jgi:hypothetical protein
LNLHGGSAHTMRLNTRMQRDGTDRKENNHKITSKTKWIKPNL